jgi:hypothetical protein
MPKNRDDSNPLEAKRRQLEQQERLLAQKRQELKEQLESRGAPAAAARIDEPPVWRMEDEHTDDPAETSGVRPRHLARQRQRDMIVFLVCGVLLIVIVVLVWVAWVHSSTPAAASPA